MFNRSDLADTDSHVDQFHQIALEKEGLDDMIINIATSNLPDTHTERALDTIALLASRKLEIEAVRQSLVNEINAAIIESEAQSSPTVLDSTIDNIS